MKEKKIEFYVHMRRTFVYLYSGDIEIFRALSDFQSSVLEN